MKIIIILFLVFFVSFYSCAQNADSIKHDFKNEISKIRKQRTDIQLNEDFKLSDFAEKFRNSKLQKLSKDSIRILLANNSIFDYNFEFIQFDLDDDKKVTKDQLVHKSKPFVDCIEGSEYNEIGVSINQKRRNYEVTILITQRYLNFQKVSYRAPIKLVHPHNSTQAAIDITGNKLIEDSYTYSLKKSLGSNSNFKPLSFKENTFSIVETWDNDQVYFYNSKGEIVAFIPIM